MRKLRSWVTRLAGEIKSLELFRRFYLQNRQNANEIESANENLSVESDSQANQPNQTKVCLKQRHACLATIAK